MLRTILSTVAVVALTACGTAAVDRQPVSLASATTYTVTSKGADATSLHNNEWWKGGAGHAGE